MVLKLEAKTNSYIRKWLGLSQCLSNVALFGRNTLKVSLQSIKLGYKREKVRLLFKLRELLDPPIQSASPQVRTGRKWNATEAVDQVQLQHQEIVGFTPGRAGLGWGAMPKRLFKATKKERKYWRASVAPENPQNHRPQQEGSCPWPCWEGQAREPLAPKVMNLLWVMTRRSQDFMTKELMRCMTDSKIHSLQEAIPAGKPDFLFKLFSTLTILTYVLISIGEIHVDNQCIFYIFF